MTSPYRERPPILACPRCGDTLNDVAGDVSMCPQCGGMWLGQPAIVAAFQDARWPHGVAMWWRRELGCPVCEANGAGDTMALVDVNGISLDRCVEHGLWFDRGELARLVGGAPAKELESLKTLLETAKAPTWVIEQQAKRDAEREARAIADARAQAAARAAREKAEQDAQAEADRKVRNVKLRAELTKERDGLSRGVDALTAKLLEAREAIAVDEEKLRELRARLRTLDNQLRELD